MSVDGRHDEFNGAAVRPHARFTRGGAGAALTLARGALSLHPSFRLDAWSGRRGPALSARLDAALGQGSTRWTAGVGSGTSTPVLADLLFRDGVGVKVNPDLRPERVLWDAGAGVSHEFAGRAGPLRVDLHGSVGHVADMVLWSPDFRFVWSPQNFDVSAPAPVRRDQWRPLSRLAAEQRDRLERRHLRSRRAAPRCAIARDTRRPSVRPGRETGGT